MYVDFGVQLIKYKTLQHFTLDKFVMDIFKKKPCLNKARHDFEYQSDYKCENFRFIKQVHTIVMYITLNLEVRITPPNSHDGPIAFYAYMSTSMTNIGGHHTLVFNVIKTNSGNGLHSTTGVFTAPSSGLYVFTWTIRLEIDSYHGVELVVNGQGVGALYQHTGSGESDMSSTTVVTHVDQGEDVFLRTRIDYNQGFINSNAYGYTSFSGWKLN